MGANPYMANRDVCNLIFVDYKTKVPFLNVDYANVTTTEITGETVFAHGGQGHPKRIGFSGERGGTIQFETQIQPFKLYSMITGAKIESSASFIARETATTTAEAATITLEGTPAVGSKVNVFKADDDCGTLVPATVAAGVVTLTTPEVGDYVVYYTKALTTGVQKINIKATTFPKAFTAYMETYNKTENDEIVFYKMTAYKCQPQTNFTITQSNTGDPASITVVADLLADKDKNILDMILLEDEEVEDEEV